eukprot:gene8860-14247_t
MFGAKCVKYGCLRAHPPSRPSDCWFGAKCINADCQRLHPKQKPSAACVDDLRWVQSVLEVTSDVGCGRGAGRGRGHMCGNAASGGGGGGGAAPARPCRHCGKRGHMDRDCTKKPPFCHSCKKKGHTKQECTDGFEECSLCFEHRQLVSLAGCEHTACAQCLRRSVLVGLKTLASYPHTCFGVGCDRTISRDALKRHKILRGDAEWASYRRFSLLAQARNNPSQRAVHCPSCDVPQLMSAHSKGWVTRECRERSCTAGSFEVAPVRGGTGNDTFVCLKGMGLDVRRCPQGCIIERTAGCDDMLCACGHRFVWTTGGTR